MKNLSGKTAVITGASSGMGRAMAVEFGRQGMNVVLVGVSEQKLEDAAAAVRATGARALPVKCDVSDRPAMFRLAERVFSEFGAVHLLCNNAGVTTVGPFADHRPGDWDWVYDVVFKGVANGIQAFYPAMIKQKEGHILNTGSQAGLVPDWTLYHGPYTAAKAAVTALTTALRPEAAMHGVGVSLLIPAYVPTDILGSARSRTAAYGEAISTEMTTPSVRSDAPAPIPGSKFMVEPEEVAHMVVRGVKANDAFIVTHPGLKPIVADYFGRILSAYDAAAKAEGIATTG